MNKIWAWIGGIGGTTVVLGAMLWGVPHYIKVQVAQQVAVISASASKPQSITDLEAKNLVIIQRLDTLTVGQTRIEGKVDTFSASFLAYLERQAGP